MLRSPLADLTRSSLTPGVAGRPRDGTRDDGDTRMVPRLSVGTGLTYETSGVPFVANVFRGQEFFLTAGYIDLWWKALS